MIEHSRSLRGGSGLVPPWSERGDERLITSRSGRGGVVLKLLVLERWSVIGPVLNLEKKHGLSSLMELETNMSFAPPGPREEV